ncbi:MULTISPECIES: polyhydroxyalkanoate synthesis repressor PhaR [Rhizobium/Agrobacterium group]|uniref:Polyhydroxyalkanoate synthesis repressor PhaR n=2 Tax=Rhizobium/Agrobacterium group TaxID=227290 RepID=A0AA92C260_RHIRH|nr:MULTISPECIES: polyhydroxyalkanoate synthesis repressor PhaR [Rhizobium/Agrobacterium group]KQM31601.1 polyhydroxyalkanoate synthesis repressor [Rhizobium sp. Leaf202]KQN82703.1 polyhydroxyalkanoate synthesis repressor [Rhizobium sp. Leaf68]KQR36729.1 polyhydroxyalkanoate synthesis repressor [Rhizobium sp. Leaf155]KRA04360.1 polyhydroxyalkanoate synthesis repressor [Rhizobium sp. Root564]MDP9573556.1 polyhydroxyalkanoate synthesis repressor PhaR [Agrobacterium larrymoorei]PVE63459.1 polyhyd
MGRHGGETIIKKYANRRLYNTGTSTYVTLEDLAKMVKRGEEFKVQDAKTSEDITHAVLTQIIVEQEAKTGNTLLPTAFLRQLISYYGDQMQMVVPTFLEHSMKTFSEQQSHMQEHMSKAFGDPSLTKNFSAPFQLMEEQIKRNTELFKQTMQMFTPFAAPASTPKEQRKPDASEIDELKAQLRNLQTKLDQL